ncbi:MAG TPA: Hsp70 family protein [Rectinemataceae bacterium]|nr:Hsp70 family protein [Rectinemataceae bacterium]
MRDAIGIDFGTTNSLCAWMDGDRPTLLNNRRGVRLTPSVVAVSAKGEVLVGESAKNQALVNPENTIGAIKGRLGAERLLQMGGRNWRAEELASMVLASLRQDAESVLGVEIRRAVITVPANFSERERRGVVEAGALAGLEVLRLVNEPTAAAVARAWSLSGMPAGPQKTSLVLVYDFGGGTFDVTLLEQEGSECRVLASRGDGHLGGADIDRELYVLAAADFLARYGTDVEADRFLAQQLVQAAEHSKIELSVREESVIGIPFALSGGAEGGKIVHPQRAITRAELERIAAPYVERSLGLTEAVLRDAGVSAGEIGSLVLSGGMSRMPMIRRLLGERLGLSPDGAVNPEEIVALGAAVWTSLLEGSARIRVRDVVSRSYGIEIDGDGFVPLIAKNSPVPASKSRVFTTVSDRQDSVEIHILQGESASAAENLSLGRFLLSGIREARKGEPRIRVDFRIDESDLLRVSAVDLDSGAQQAISIADIGRGASSEPPEQLLGKIRVLVDRVSELRAGINLERSLDAELDEVIARAGAAPSSAIGGEAGLRLLKVELEALVGELLARRDERRVRDLRSGPESGR